VRALRATLALAALCTAANARAADETVVVSPAADAVSVTVYRDDLALITETRTVTLPSEPVTLAIDGVVETLLPQSAVIDGAQRPLAESNFSFDQLTPASLLRRSIGESVTLTRTNPKTGRVTRERARIVSAEDGVVLEVEGGHEALRCSGLPERLELDKVPGDLLAKPRLSVRLAAGDAGPRTVKVSYLAHGFEWSSDYVAHLNHKSDRMRLDGWATLVNRTSTAFAQTQVQVVAGRLNLLNADEGGSRGDGVDADNDASGVDQAVGRPVRGKVERFAGPLHDCFAAPLPVAPQGVLSRAFALAGARAKDAMLEEVIVTGSRIMSRENLGDYQLYRMPFPTDLGARQTKQVAFLAKPSVRIERFYSFRLDHYLAQPESEVVTPNVVVSFENTAHAGLGEPLPRGDVRVFETYGDTDVFAGEAQMNDRPVGLPVELAIGRAANLTLDATIGFRDDRRFAADYTLVTAEHRVMNNKGVPITMEIRHGVESDWESLKVRSASMRMRKKFGDIAWRFSVPAGSVAVLSYELEATR
jgi:hypothetical protein